jgi:Mlc titration factor MtfA (ptsG expression regulator)
VRGRWRWRRSIDPPAGWEDEVAASLVHFDVLDDDERELLGVIIGELLGRKHWEAARGFDLTAEMRLTIAAQAALLALGLPTDCFREVKAIIVTPTTRVLTGPRPGPAAGVVVDGPFPVIGQAHGRRGPVIIAWDAVRRDLRRPHRGHNVVFHEFAHKLDMLDGYIDGTPPLADPATHQRWVAVCTAEYESLRAGEAGELLSPYAGTNPGEFFAVATEVFFAQPVELRDQKPDLYEVLAGFYRQDPAARVIGFLRSDRRSGLE